MNLEFSQTTKTYVVVGYYDDITTLSLWYNDIGIKCVNMAYCRFNRITKVDFRNVSYSKQTRLNYFYKAIGYYICY